MNRTLKDQIEDLCNNVILNEEDNYHEWLQEHEDTGTDHLYSLACSILTGIEKEPVE
jgi:hypothetical protein